MVDVRVYCEGRLMFVVLIESDVILLVLIAILLAVIRSYL